MRTAEHAREAGLLYRDPAAPSGYAGYYAVDIDGELAYRVQIRASQMTPERLAGFRREARELCGQRAVLCLIP